MLLTLFDMVEVEAWEECPGTAPLRADHHVVFGLVPEVVAERCDLIRPRTLDTEVAVLYQDEATWRRKSAIVSVSN